MDHVFAKARLSAYLDDELAADVRAGVELHLAGCPECRGELLALRETSALLRRLPVPGVSAEVRARLQGAIDGAAAGKRMPGVERFIGVLSGVAACLAIAGTLMLMQPRAVASPAVAGAWEHDAVRLSPADPLEAAPENDIGNWMVANLASRGEAP